MLKTFNLINKESIDPIDLFNKKFEEIKKKKVYFDLFKKEKKIKVDFHSNSDLFNFIKQISLEAGRLSTFENNEVIDIIEKYIERN